MLFETCPSACHVISSAPIPLLATCDVISGSSRLPWQHFRFDDVISGPSLDPMHDRAPSPNPSVPVPKKRHHGQAGHVGQIRLSDWLKFEMLRSDWSGSKPTPYITNILRCDWWVKIMINNAVLVCISSENLSKEK